MTEEQKATAQRVIDRLIAKRKVYGTLPELETKTPAEINAPVDSAGKATPASFISPYYGEQFNNEVKKAKFENTTVKALTNESYPALFEDVTYYRQGNKGAAYRPANERRDYPLINLTGPEGLQRLEKYASSLKQALNMPKDSYEYKKALNAVEGNALNKPEEIADDSGTAEHEFGHHYANASPELKKSIGGDYIGEAFSMYTPRQTHMSDPDELVNALGRLQRETFKATGKRYDSEGFKKLVQSKETPEYLTSEGQRAINHMRLQYKNRETPNSKEGADKYLDIVSKLVPALVKNEEPKSFEDAVNQRIS